MNDFKEWYLPYIRKQRPDYDKFSDDQVWRKFTRMTNSNKWGVYLDYFEDHSIILDVRPVQLYGTSLYYEVHVLGAITKTGISDRIEAQKYAIDQGDLALSKRKRESN